MATALDQLRYIDEQLNLTALSADKLEAVRAHRLTGVQLRQQKMAELGPMPADAAEQQEWEKRKREVEAEVDLQLAEMRLSVDGLEESWDQWQEREKLKSFREQLLQGQATPGGLAGLQPAQQQPAPISQQPQHVQQVHAEHSPGALQDAASWESLQIAPLQNPQAWEVQQHAQHLQQQLQVQLQAQAEQAQQMQQSQQVQESQQMQLAQGGQPMQQAWQQMQPPVQGQVMGQPQVNPDGAVLKLCRRCNTHKPLTEFYRSKANADGYDGRCKACDAIQCAQRRKRKERIENPTVEWKCCRRCGNNKPATDFYRNKTNADGLYNNCKACFAQDAVNRRERLPPLEERTAVAKECKRCKETKAASEFYKNKLMSDGLYSHCKACYSQAANERSAGRAPAETKRCRRCGNTKEAADFYVSKMTADGLQSYCKACYAVASAARRNRVNHDQQQQQGQPGMPLDQVALQQQALQHQAALQGQMAVAGQVPGMQQTHLGQPVDPSLQGQEHHEHVDGLSYEHMQGSLEHPGHEHGMHHEHGVHDHALHEHAANAKPYDAAHEHALHEHAAHEQAMQEHAAREHAMHEHAHAMHEHELHEHGVHEHGVHDQAPHEHQVHEHQVM